VPTAVLVDYIDQHRDRFGVEPTCTVLQDAGAQIDPSTCYAAKTRPRPRMPDLGAVEPMRCGCLDPVAGAGMRHKPGQIMDAVAATSPDRVLEVSSTRSVVMEVAAATPDHPGEHVGDERDMDHP
jgi:hypothetical protein